MLEWQMICRTKEVRSNVRKIKVKCENIFIMGNTGKVPYKLHELLCLIFLQGMRVLESVNCHMPADMHKNNMLNV